MNFTVKTRLVLLGCIGGLMAIATGASGWWGTARQGTGLATVVRTTNALRDQMQADMMHDALRADVFAALLAKTPEEHNEVKKALAEHSQSFRESIEVNTKAGLSAEVARALEAITPKVLSYAQKAELIVNAAAVDHRGAEAALPAFTSAFEELEGEMGKLGDLVEASATDSQREAATTQRDAQVGIAIAVGLSCVALAAGALLIIRSILVPLRNTQAVLTKATGGDLTARVQLTSKDEFATLGDSFNIMLTNMARIVKAVSDSSAVVVSSAEEISSAGSHPAEGMRAQSKHVDNLLASMKEMSDSITDVAQRCASAAKAAQESESAAAHGGLAIGGTIDDMTGIRESVKKGADIVSGLGKRSEEIGRIIGVINDIADQTNLLALNAAIEAARAGEHGRGFAVVADEVRKLADRTTAATNEVAKSIRTIQDETGLAVSQIDDGVKRVTEGAGRATQAGDELGKIVSTVHQVADMIRTIAAAAEEQSATAGKIADTMGTVKTATERVASQADRIQTVAETLSERSRDVASLVGQFKV